MQSHLKNQKFHFLAVILFYNDSPFQYFCISDQSMVSLVYIK
jgi:hypothetical protein